MHRSTWPRSAPGWPGVASRRSPTAGAGNGPSELAALAAVGLPQRVTAMTAAPDTLAPDGLGLGPVKVLLDDADLPSLDALRERFDAARAAGRSVAVHCVSDAAVVLALAAGVGRTDRIEHGSLVPDELLPVLAAAGPTVVVQPVLVATKGDRYLVETPEAEHRGLHRLASLQQAGLRVAASSDAPYGDPDPWAGVAAAVARTTAAAAPFGPTEAVDPIAVRPPVVRLGATIPPRPGGSHPASRPTSWSSTTAGTGSPPAPAAGHARRRIDRERHASGVATNESLRHSRAPPSTMAP